MRCNRLLVALLSGLLLAVAGSGFLRPVDAAPRPGEEQQAILDLFEKYFDKDNAALEKALRELNTPVANTYLAMFLHWERPELRTPDGEIAELLEKLRNWSWEAGNEYYSKEYDKFIGVPDPYDGSDDNLILFLRRYSAITIPCGFFLKNADVGGVVKPDLGIGRQRLGSLDVACGAYLRSTLPKVFAFWVATSPYTWEARRACNSRQGTIIFDISLHRQDTFDNLFYDADAPCPGCEARKLGWGATLRHTSLGKWSQLSLWNYRNFVEAEALYAEAIEQLSAYYIEIFSMPERLAKQRARAGLLSQLQHIEIYQHLTTFDRLRDFILQGADLQDVSPEVLRPPRQAKTIWDRIPYFGVADPLLLLAVDNPDALHRLLEAGHDPNTANHFGKTTLMAAAQTGNSEVVTLLIDQGAAINARSSHPFYIPKNDVTGVIDRPYDTSCGPYAIRHGHRTALMYAADNAGIEVIRALLDAGADASLKDTMGKTALDYLNGAVRSKGETNPALTPEEHELAAKLLTEAMGPPADGPGFDCAKAGTPIEKAICADDELSKEDYRMSATYSALFKTLEAGERKTLIDEQRGWIEERAEDCLPQGEIGDIEAMDNTHFDACILASTVARTNALEIELRRTSPTRP